MNKKINANYGQAVLKPLEEGEQSYGGIVIPDMGQETSRMGHIVELSPIYNFNLGTFVDSKFKIGDLVLFAPLGGCKVKLDGGDYIIISITDLLASIEN